MLHWVCYQHATTYIIDTGRPMRKKSCSNNLYNSLIKALFILNFLSEDSFWSFISSNFPPNENFKNSPFPLFFFLPWFWKTVAVFFTSTFISVFENCIFYSVVNFYVGNKVDLTWLDRTKTSLKYHKRNEKDRNKKGTNIKVSICIYLVFFQEIHATN